MLMLIYSCCANFLALLSTCLASAYLWLRHRDGQSDSTFLPTWQTVASVVSISLILVVYIITIYIYYRNPLYKNRTAFNIRTGVLFFLIAFYFGVTYQNLGVDVTTDRTGLKNEYKCIQPSVRCNVGMAQLFALYGFFCFGLCDAAMGA